MPPLLQTLRLPMMLIGDKKPESLLQLKIKDHADHAGASAPPDFWKDMLLFMLLNQEAASLNNN